MLETASDILTHASHQSIYADGRLQAELHHKAGIVRNHYFGTSVFVRGVVEISNFCRQNCSYCGMRRENRSLKRNRAQLEKLQDLIIHHRPASITDINIQAGEDPIAVRDIAIPLIRKIREETNLGMSVCLGILSTKEYDQLREAGAEYYIIKLETGDPIHYRQIQAPGSLEKRLQAIEYLNSSGWKVSSGFIVGLPFQTTEHLMSTLDLLYSLPLTGCSVSPFIAGEQTPFSQFSNGNIEATLNCLALMRHATPLRIIPAVSAMGLVGFNGYARAIQAGANLVTMNLTPSDLRENYVIYKRNRIIMDEERVLQAVQQAGCEISKVSLFQYLKENSVSL
jgi:biotin synthase